MSEFWDKFKEGFKPTAERADANIARKQGHNQLSEDMKLSKEERAAKLRQGFLKKIGS